MNSTSRDDRRCPICGSVSSLVYEDLKDLFVQTTDDMKRFCVYLCGSCGVGHTSPQITYEDFSRYYPPDYEAYKRRAGFRQFLLRLKYRHDLKMIKRGTAHGARSVYEIGAGRGEFLSVARERGFEVGGTEPSDAGRQQARNMHGIALEKSHGENVTFHKMYDVVVLRHVFEHLANPVWVLEQILDTGLYSGGLLFLKIPNFESWEREWFAECWHDLDVPRHLFHYSRTSIARILENTGFEKIRVLEEVIPTAIEGSLRNQAIKVLGAHWARVYAGLPSILRLLIAQSMAVLYRRRGPGRIVVCAQKPAARF